MELFSLMAKLTLDSDDFMDKIEEAEDAIESFDEPDSPQLGLDNSEFNENIEESGALGEGFQESMSTAFGKVASALTAAGIVGTLAGIVQWLKKAIDMTAETADGIDKGAKRLDISRKAYQNWDHALKQSGASINDVGKGIRNFQAVLNAADMSNFQDAEDHMEGLAEDSEGLSSKVVDALDKLGLLEKVTSGEIRDTEQLMEQSLMALAGMDNKTERGILLRALFGNNADGMNALLDEGVQGVKELLKESEDLGLNMSDEEIDNAVAYGDAIANLQDELQALQSAFVADIIPILTDAVTKVTEFLAALNPRNQETGLEKTLADIDNKALDAGKSLDDTGTKAKLMIEKLAGMGDYWTLDDKGKKTWNALAQEFIDTYPQFADYVNLENGVIQGNTAEIEKNIDAWVRREKQILLDNAVMEKKQAIAEQYAKAVDKEVQADVVEGEAFTKRADALQAMEDFLNSSRGKGYKTNLERNYGYTGEMTEEFYRQHGAGITGWIDEYGTGAQKQAIKDWKDTEEQVKSLREEAKALDDEAKQMEEDLEVYNEALEKRLNGTQTEADATKKKIEELTKALSAIPNSIPISFPLFGNLFRPHAIGSDYIPYDNYPALLHRGERVLTATEARQSGNVDLSGLEDRIEAAIRAGMSGARVNAYLDGREVTDAVNRNNINDVKGRRFR